MSDNTNDLDLLLGLPRPIDEMTDAELQQHLLQYFPHTRPYGTDVAALLSDPLLAGIPNLQEIINDKSKFKLKRKT